MASSSSSTSSEHDVFLSFRGKDTRYNIVSHLHEALKDKNIPTFVDDEMERGEEITPALIQAIEVSKISVIIFSENYADSKWCLDELVKILECKDEAKQKVIPVFYKVEPSDVGNQTGEFGKAFGIPANKHESKREIWENALRKAGKLSGYNSSTIRSEALLVKTIIGDILEKLKNGSNNDTDFKELFGIDSSMKKIEDLLKMESGESRIVGIWGMGGIGKTTIAEAVFHKLSCQFQSCFFLLNIREKSKTEGLVKMRNELISKLWNGDNLAIDTPRTRDSYTKGRLNGRKVLVVLDDVDDSSQLEGLIGELGTDPFGPGSRVIVTTRDKHVLEAYDITDVYEMELLHDNEALRLFSSCALRPNQPTQLYRDISIQIVKHAQGVPLPLKILGFSLRGKTDIEYWKGELKKLKEIPHKKISDVFKISYDSLTREEKDIFLDISCFFKGTNVNTFRNVLDGCYVSLRSGMDVLIDKSLINIISHKRRPVWAMTPEDSFDTVEMHDLLQEMGWNIVMEESKEVKSRSRIWRPEDMFDALTKKTGTTKIKSILLDMGLINQTNLDPQAFAKMHNLKFLKIYNHFWESKIQFPSGLESLPEGLRYLEWQGCPLEYWPPTFYPTNLVELHLIQSPLKRLWSGRQDLHNLKVIRLNGCNNLIEIPDLSLAIKLEELDIVCCNQLDKLPSSIQHLQNLKHLILRSCDRLVIPSFIGHFTRLTNLEVVFCTGLIDIPPSIKYLINLTHLDLSSFSNLAEIPPSIQHLTSLTHLYLNRCINLTEIPSSIQNLKNLITLDLSSCHGLTELPSAIGHLRSLTHLYLVCCYRLKTIPSSIQNLTNLIYLNLSGCNSLTEIPHSIQHLSNLTYLDLNKCSGLKDIPSSIQYLNSLTHLHLMECIRIKKLPNLPKNIKFLELHGSLIGQDPSPNALLPDLAELVLWNSTDNQISSILLEKVKLLTPPDCNIIEKTRNWGLHYIKEQEERHKEGKREPVKKQRELLQKHRELLLNKKRGNRQPDIFNSLGENKTSHTFRLQYYRKDQDRGQRCIKEREKRDEEKEREKVKNRRELFKKERERFCNKKRGIGQPDFFKNFRGNETSQTSGLLEHYRTEWDETLSKTSTKERERKKDETVGEVEDVVFVVEGYERERLNGTSSKTAG